MYKINACVDDITLDVNNICSKCDKKLVDLRNLHHDEVKELVSSSKTSICAIAAADKFHSKYYLHPFKRFAFAMILVFGSSLFVMGNETEQSVLKIQSELFQTPNEGEKQNNISGKINEENGLPIVGASVTLNYNGKVLSSTTSNIDGEYALHYPIGSYKKGLSLTISADEFEGINEIILHPIPRLERNVTLIRESMKVIVMGKFVKD